MRRRHAFVLAALVQRILQAQASRGMCTPCGKAWQSVATRHAWPAANGLVVLPGHIYRRSSPVMMQHEAVMFRFQQDSRVSE